MLDFRQQHSLTPPQAWSSPFHTPVRIPGYSHSLSSIITDTDQPPGYSGSIYILSLHLGSNLSQRQSSFRALSKPSAGRATCENLKLNVPLDTMWHFHKSAELVQTITSGVHWPPHLDCCLLGFSFANCQLTGIPRNSSAGLLSPAAGHPAKVLRPFAVNSFLLKPFLG